MLFSKLLTATGGHQLVFVGGVGYASVGDLSLTNLTGGIETSAKAGDLVIYAMMGDLSGPSPTPPNITTPGYTFLKQAATYNSTYAVGAVVFVYYKRLTTAETIVNPAGYAFPGAQLAQVWRYASETSPFDVAATTATGQGSTAANPAAITTVTTGAVMLGIGFGFQQGISASQYTEAPAGTAYLTAVDNYKAPTYPLGVVIDVDGVNGIAASDPLIVPGTYNFGAFGPNNVSTNNVWAAVTIALRPRG